MIDNKLGFNLDSIEYGTIFKRNKSISAIFLLVTVVNLFVCVPFLVLWIQKTPIDIDGVLRQSHEIEYIRFMVIFFIVFGSTSFGLLSLALFFLLKSPLEYIVIGKDNDFNKYIEIKHSSKSSYFISDNSVFEYRYDKDEIIDLSTSHTEDLVRKHLFWKRWSGIENYKLTNKNGKAVLTFKNKEGRTASEYRYGFKIGSGSFPDSISEIVQGRTGMRNSNFSYNEYLLTDINRSKNQRIPMKVAEIIGRTS